MTRPQLPFLQHGPALYLLFSASAGLLSAACLIVTFDALSDFSVLSEAGEACEAEGAEPFEGVPASEAAVGAGVSSRWFLLLLLLLLRFVC